MLVKVQGCRLVAPTVGFCHDCAEKAEKHASIVFFAGNAEKHRYRHDGLNQLRSYGSKHEANPEQRGAAIINLVSINTLLGHEFFAAYHIRELSNPCLNCSNNCIIP